MYCKLKDCKIHLGSHWLDSNNVWKVNNLLTNADSTLGIKVIQVSVAAYWDFTAWKEFLYYQFQQYSSFEGAAKWGESFNLATIVIMLLSCCFWFYWSLKTSLVLIVLVLSLRRQSPVITKDNFWKVKHTKLNLFWKISLSCDQQGIFLKIHLAERYILGWSRRVRSILCNHLFSGITERFKYR